MAPRITTVVLIALIAWALAPYQHENMPWQGAVLERVTSGLFGITKIISQYNPELGARFFRFMTGLPTHARRLNDIPYRKELKIHDTFMGAGNVPVRVYEPMTPSQSPRGALIYIHGGGWTISSVESHDPICQILSAKSDYIVISVEYPLSPEHKYPVAPNTCYDVTKHVIENAAGMGIDPKKVVVGGDSAGGALSAAMTHMFRKKHGDDERYRLAGQMLLYPAVDTNFLTESVRKFGENTLLSRDLMIWFWSNYIPVGQNLDDPILLPLRAKSFKGLPPAYVAVCEYDVLLSEGIEYMNKLKETGVNVSFKFMKGCFHGVLGMLVGPVAVMEAREEVVAAAEWLKSL